MSRRCFNSECRAVVTGQPVQIKAKIRAVGKVVAPGPTRMHVQVTAIIGINLSEDEFRQESQSVCVSFDENVRLVGDILGTLARVAPVQNECFHS